MELVAPTSTMASPELSSRPHSLLALPPEIHVAILPHLQFLDLHTLRLVNHFFHALILPPLHDELLSAEKTPNFDFGTSTHFGALLIDIRHSFKALFIQSAIRTQGRTQAKLMN
jgi:hypothetical protein